MWSYNDQAIYHFEEIQPVCTRWRCLFLETVKELNLDMVLLDGWILLVFERCSDFWRCHVAFEALEAPLPADWTEHFDSSAAASADLSRSSVDRILDGPKMSRASHFSLPGTTTESKTCETCETCEKMGLWGSGLLLQRIYKSKLLVVVLAMTPPDAVGYGILWQNIKRLMLHLLHKLFCDFLCWRSAVSAICVKI